MQTASSVVNSFNARPSGRALLLLAALALGSAFAAPGGAKESRPSIEKGLPGLMLKPSCPGANSYIVKVTAAAIRIEHRSGDFYLLSREPDWTVYVIRPRTREYAAVSHKDWCEKYQLRNGAWPSLLGPVQRTVRRLEEGRRAIVYYFGQTGSQSYSDCLFRSATALRSQSGQGTNHCEIICLDLPQSSRSGPVLGRLQNLPPVAGLPIAARRIFDSGTVNGAITTAALPEEKFLADSLFVLPQGYRKIAFDTKLVMSSAQAENTADLFKEFLGK